MLRRTAALGFRCVRNNSQRGFIGSNLKIQTHVFSWNRGTPGLARYFSADQNSQSESQVVKKQFSNLKLYEIVAKEQLASSLKRGRQLSIISTGLALGAAVLISPPVIVLFAIAGFMAYRNVTRFEARSALTITKVTITPEKDKLIFEYGIIDTKHAEVEIEHLETKILQTSKKEQNFGVRITKEVVVTLLVPNEHKSVVITDRELLLAAVTANTEELQKFEYVGNTSS